MTYLKHFFISQLVNQTESSLKKQKPNNDFGKFISISFIAGTDLKIIQRLKFEKYTGDSTLSDKDSKRLQSLLSINVEKEMKGENDNKKPCKNIFAIINAQTKEIKVQYLFTDDTIKNLNF